jgi:hypothetical protein
MDVSSCALASVALPFSFVFPLYRTDALMARKCKRAGRFFAKSHTVFETRKLLGVGELEAGFDAFQSYVHLSLHR